MATNLNLAKAANELRERLAASVYEVVVVLDGDIIRVIPKNISNTITGMEKVYAVAQFFELDIMVTLCNGKPCIELL